MDRSRGAVAPGTTTGDFAAHAAAAGVASAQSPGAPAAEDGTAAAPRTRPPSWAT